MKRAFRKIVRKFVSLDKIAASFNKAIADLRKLQEANHAERMDNDEELARILAENVKLERESAKAARFQKNLEALIGG